MCNGRRRAIIWCSLDGSVKSYCTPESYKGTSSKLYHNLGSGRFEDVTAKAGLGDPNSKSLGVTVIDFDNDGWPDLFVANDTQPNKLYRNNRNGTFQREGHAGGRGLRRRRRGARRHGRRLGRLRPQRRARICWLAISPTRCWGFITTKATGLFVDEAPHSSVGRDSLLSLTFGVFFFDYDLDGYPDILAANGHIEEEIGRVQPKIHYQEPPLLFRNLGAQEIRERVERSGRGLHESRWWRAARSTAISITTAISTSAHLQQRPRAPVIATTAAIRTTGFRSAPSGRNPIATASAPSVAIASASGKQWNMVRSGSSYASQSDLALIFGLGQDPVVTSIEVAWPSGTKQKFANVATNQFITIDETRGIVK